MSGLRVNMRADTLLGQAYFTRTKEGSQHEYGLDNEEINRVSRVAANRRTRFDCMLAITDRSRMKEMVIKRSDWTGEEYRSI